MAGLLAGSYLYVMASGWIGRTFKTWGDHGKPMLPSLVGVRQNTFVIVFALVLIGALVLLEAGTIR